MFSLLILFFLAVIALEIRRIIRSPRTAVVKGRAAKKAIIPRTSSLERKMFYENAFHLDELVRERVAKEKKAASAARAQRNAWIKANA